MKPLLPYPPPPKEIITPKISTRIRCFRKKGIRPEIFNIDGIIEERFISTYIPKTGIAYFQFATVTTHITYVQGKETSRTRNTTKFSEKKYLNC